MSGAGAHRRPYRSRARREGAERTRQRILDAAELGFVERGYAATTIASVAAVAGTAPETVYAAFGTKALLLEAVIRRAARGEGDDEILAQQGPEAALGAESQRELLRLFAADIAGRLERVAPLLEVLASAAAAEEHLAALYRGLHEARLRNLRAVAAVLERLGPLRVARTEAAETVWAIASPELYRLLTSQRGWTTARYRRWLESALAGALVADTPAR